REKERARAAHSTFPRRAPLIIHHYVNGNARHGHHWAVPRRRCLSMRAYVTAQPFNDDATFKPPHTLLERHKERYTSYKCFKIDGQIEQIDTQVVYRSVPRYHCRIPSNDRIAERRPKRSERSPPRRSDETRGRTREASNADDRRAPLHLPRRPTLPPRPPHSPPRHQSLHQSNPDPFKSTAVENATRLQDVLQDTW
ncbi:hypothetical protein ALC56_05472, partial [Trachymyrmex septentrionalis]